MKRLFAIIGIIALAAALSSARSLSLSSSQLPAPSSAQTAALTNVQPPASSSAQTAALTCAQAPVPSSALAPSQAPTVKTGEIDGAPFRIQIPPDWNHCLVMYAHAYLPRGATWIPLPGHLGAVFLSRGFALAESGYSRQGWAFEEGFRETEALRRYFSEQYGEPDTTFIAGHSLGGFITLALIERHPDSHEGALPLCGLLSPALVFFKDRVFDMLVTFKFLFEESLPQEYKPVVEAPSLPAQIIMNALGSDPVAAEIFARHWDVREDNLPYLLSFDHSIYRELVERAGGNPIDNRSTIYAGFGWTPELNGRVRRYAAAPEALAYLRRHYTPTGVIEDPVIAVHTTYDPGIPPHLANYYHTLVSLTGCDEWFIQHRVEADGHCNIDRH
jgi:pimeloyl-ACP methyl ester carboxylesterase